MYKSRTLDKIDHSMGLQAASYIWNAPAKLGGDRPKITKANCDITCHRKELEIMDSPHGNDSLVAER